MMAKCHHGDSSFSPRIGWINMSSVLMYWVCFGSHGSYDFVPTETTTCKCTSKYSLSVRSHYQSNHINNANQCPWCNRTLTVGRLWLITMLCLRIAGHPSTCNHMLVENILLHSAEVAFAAGTVEDAFYFPRMEPNGMRPAIRLAKEKPATHGTGDLLPPIFHLCVIASDIFTPYLGASPSRRPSGVTKRHGTMHVPRYRLILINVHINNLMLRWVPC